jgi:hypothetical protein
MYFQKGKQKRVSGRYETSRVGVSAEIKEAFHVAANNAAIEISIKLLFWAT